MADKGHVIVKVKADTTDLESGLKKAERTARSAVGALSSIYQKAGMDQSAAMKRAWAEVSAAQKSGQTVVINGVETIITENEKVIDQKDKLGQVYDELGKDAKNAAEEVEKAGGKLSKVGDGIKKRLSVGWKATKVIGGISAATTLALGAIAKKGVDYNAQMEQLRVSFETMTGSAEKAAEVVERLRVMGAETPFEALDLASTTQMLMQYGFTADEAIDRMRMLGDISQGNANALNSIAMGYAQMSSAGKVNLQDIKQMIGGGFNPLQEISERTGESMESLYDRISRGTMAVEEITESMRYATSEGGKFFQSMEKQSQTLNGQISTLKDNAMQLLGSMTGDLSEGMASSFLPMANNIIAELQEAYDKGGTKGLADAATGMIPDLMGMMTGELEQAMSGLTRWMPDFAKKLLKAFPSGLKVASNLLPQITTALFGIAREVSSGLIGMLPELVPEFAAGLINTFGAALNGMADLLGGLFEGVEQALHRGQTKVLGAWVDDTEIAKYDFGMEVDVDTSAAESEITTAYTTIREALAVGPLTDTQKAEILSMLGQDADAIKAKLMEFGMDSTAAGEVAATISGSGQIIADALNGLDLGVDTGTVLKWIAQANGSHVLLRSAALQAGLSESDIAEISGVFDEMNGKLADGTPNIASTIFTKLTDGLADDEATVSGLKADVEGYTEDLLEGAITARDEAIAALDPNSANYQAKVAEIQADYDATVAQIGELKNNMLAYVDTYAGATTDTVIGAAETIAEMERLAGELEEKTGIARETMASQGQQAFNATRAGAKVDEETISLAIKFKYTEFRMDEQAAEDAYTAARDELLAKLEKREISQEQYNADQAVLEADLEAAKAAAQSAYERAIGEIFAGLAESSGVQDQFNAAVEQEAANAYIQNLIGAFEGMDVAAMMLPVGQTMSQEMIQAFATALGEAPENVEFYSGKALEDVLEAKLGDGMQNSDEIIAQIIENSQFGSAFAAALEAGMLEDTAFEDGDMTEQLSALLKSVATSATSQMGDYDGAKAAGNETVKGLTDVLDDSISSLYAKGRAMGGAVMRGYRNVMAIKSPSREMRKLGNFTGEGLAQGLQESMQRAVNMANHIMGGLTTSASFVGTSRLTMPDLTAQLIAASNNQEPTPIYLDGWMIAQIQAQNNSQSIAFENARDSRAVGGR